MGNIWKVMEKSGNVTRRGRLVTLYSAMCTWRVRTYYTTSSVYAVRVDVPYKFDYGDGVHANKSVLFDLDRITASIVVQRLDQVNWFNRNFGVCVVELVLYTPYSDLLTQVHSSTKPMKLSQQT